MKELEQKLSLPLRLGWRKTTPQILQAEASECGLACIAMIAGYHGLNIDLHKLRSAPIGTQQGTNLNQLISLAQSLNLSSRALKLEPEHLNNLQLPCILHWNMQHYVVLTKVTAKGIHIQDPAIGRKKVSWHDVDQRFTGVALELQPTGQFTPAELRQPLKLQHLWQNIVGLKRSLILLFALSMLLQIFSLASPYYMQIVIDDVIANSDKALLTVLLGGFALLILVETFTSLTRQLTGIIMSSHLAQQLSVNVFHHLLTLPYQYFSQRHIGDLVSRFGCLNEVRTFISQGIVSLILDSLIILFTFILMAMYSLKLTVVSCGFALLFIVLRVLFFQPIQRLQQERISSAAKENTHFIESIRGIQTIRMLKLEIFRLNGWQNCFTETLNRDIRIRQWNMSFNLAQVALFALENLIVIYLAATLVIELSFSIGMLYAYISYKSRFMSSVNSLIEQMIQWKLLRVHLDRLADIVQTPSAITLSPTANLANSHSICAHNLQLKKMGYAYKGQPPLLKQLNLCVPAGKMVVITGASGSGKSTLVKCLAGLLHPSEGEVLLDNSPLNSRTTHQKVSAVMQDDICLSGTIIDNVCGFQQDVDMQRLVQCCELACIHKTISQLPMQYFTQIHEGGTNLSGGQRQRLYLARALYQQPALLILDESSSHLDSTCEHQINQHLSQLPMTRVVVAHRRETIEMASKRYHLSGGRLQEVAINFSPEKLQHNPQGDQHV